MVFYSGNLCFCREKLVEIPWFFGGKERLVLKTTSFNIENDSFLRENLVFAVKTGIFYYETVFSTEKNPRISTSFSL